MPPSAIPAKPRRPSLAGLCSAGAWACLSLRSLAARLFSDVLSPRPALAWKWVHIAGPDALPQRGLEVGGPAVLSQKIAKCFIGQALKIDAAVACQECQGLQGLFIELNSFAWHVNCSNK
jgi:hypothetical protein